MDRAALRRSRIRERFAALVVGALLAVGCSTSDDEPEAAPPTTPTTLTSTSTSTSTTTTTSTVPLTATELLATGAASSDDWVSLGDGREVVIGRANWSGGYVHPLVMTIVLAQLGYAPTDPAEAEFAPDLAYQALAEGEIDLWHNGWFPGHDEWFEGDLPSGSRIGDHVTVVGAIVPQGGIQAIFIDLQAAVELELTSIQDIEDDPAIAARFDIDGNGKADILGCPEEWTCDDIIEMMIIFYGWENIEQIKAPYHVSFERAMDRVEGGEPVLAYAWTPTGFYHEAGFGDRVAWISMHPTDVLDDINYFGHDVRAHDQRPGGWAEHCIEPCQLGWLVRDIRSVANAEFLAGEPVIEALLERFEMTVDDISELTHVPEGAIRSERLWRQLAEGWVEENQAQIDLWIVEALLAAGEL